MIHLSITVSNTADLLAAQAYGPGALLRWESGAAAAGPFVEGGTVALVSGTSAYDVWDAAGTAGTWYRTRISNAPPTTYSAYSAVFQGGVPSTYADVDQAVTLFETRPNASRLQRLATALGTATNELIGESGGRDYFRHPAFSADDATNVWYADGRGASVLCVHQGIIGLSKLEVSWDLGATFSEITSAQYTLMGSDPNSSAPLPIGEPYFHVRLVPYAGWVIFPRGPRTVRLTGAWGWPSIPAALVESCAARARQLTYGDASYSGSLPSDDAYGHVSVPAIWPHVLYKFLERERSRFFCAR